MSTQAAETAQKVRDYIEAPRRKVNTTTPKKPRKGVETTEEYLARGGKLELVARGVTGNKDNQVYGKSTSWLALSKK